MFAENCRTERVFVDGHSVFELREIEREREGGLCWHSRERRRAENSNANTKKSLINWNVTVERNAGRSHWTDGRTQRVDGRAQWRANRAR